MFVRRGWSGGFKRVILEVKVMGRMWNVEEERIGGLREGPCG